MHWTVIPDPRTPLGARGIGEIGVTGVAAAIANAVFNASVDVQASLGSTADAGLADPQRVCLGQAATLHGTVLKVVSVEEPHS